MVKKAKPIDLSESIEKEIMINSEPVYSGTDVYNFLEELVLTRGSNRYYNDVLHEWDRKVKADMEKFNV